MPAFNSSSERTQEKNFSGLRDQTVAHCIAIVPAAAVRVRARMYDAISH